MNRLPEKLVKLRKHFKYSQEYVANYLGMAVFDYIDVENGTKMLSYSLLKKLSFLYEIDTEELFINDLDVTLVELHDKTIDETNMMYFTKKKFDLNSIRQYIKNHYIMVTVVTSLAVAVLVLLIIVVKGRVTLDLDTEISILNRLSVNDTNVLYVDSNGGVKGAGDNSNNQLAYLPTSNIVSVKQGKDFEVFLSQDGSVDTSNVNYQDEVNNWENIVEIGAGEDFIVGLDKSGKLHYAGNDEKLKSEVESLSAITNIFVCDEAILSINYNNELTISGTLLGSSIFKKDNDIVDIDTSDNITVVLYNDGSVAYIDSDGRVFSDVSNWTNIVDVCCGSDFIAGLKEDNSVVLYSFNDKITSNKLMKWTNVVAIDAANNYLIGLTDSYNIYGVGECRYNQFKDDDAPSTKTLTQLDSIDSSTIKFTLSRENEDKYKLNVSFDENRLASTYKVELECDDGSNQSYIIEDNSIDFLISNKTLNVTFKITCLGDKENYGDSQTTIISTLIDSIECSDCDLETISIPDIKGHLLSEAIDELMTLNINNIELNVATSGCDLSKQTIKVQQYDGYDSTKKYTSEELAKLKVNITKCGE